MQELLDFIRMLPEFVDSGIDSRSISVWAQFADGKQIIFTDDMLPNASLARTEQAATSSRVGVSIQPTASSQSRGSPVVSAPGQATTGVPVSSAADFYSSLGAGFTSPGAVSNIAAWSKAQKYGTGNVADPTVQALKTVGGEGIFFIASHAGFGSIPGLATYAVWTSTEANEAEETVDRQNCPAMQTAPPCDIIHDLDSIPAALVEMTARTLDSSTGQIVLKTHYAITAEFVSEYWRKFSPNSFVFIAACYSDSPNAIAFKNAILGKGASVYAGWSGRVGDPYTADVAQFVFDRLLGANQDTGTKEDPPQRPFDYASVLGDLADFDLQSDPNPENFGTHLQFTRNPDQASGQFVLLAPSISYMVMNEYKQQLMINGIFGTDPRHDGSAASVQVGGTINTQNGVQVVENGKNVNIASWAPDQIVVDLPLSGDGSAGNVQVNARGHLSNVAQLTEWRGDQDFHFTISGPGSLQQQQVYSLHLRADIRKWRRVIHKPPDEPQGQVVSANDSTGTHSSNGTDVVTFPGPPSCTVTAIWSGSGALVNMLLGAPDNTLLLSEPLPSVYDSEHMPGLYMVALSIHGMTCTRTDCTGVPTKETEPVFGPSQVTFPTPTFTFTLDKQFGIQANQVDLPGLPICDVTQTDGNGTFKWGSIAATENTAPNSESAR
jgi:hypothetical protein